MKNRYLRAITLGTSLTALFLLVRCSVPGRDYSPLGIGDNAGGEGGTIGDVVLNSAGTGGQAGQDGLADAGGEGGAPPLPPIPCTVVRNDAGSEDAGSEDAGSEDAGSTDAGSTDPGSSDAGSPNEPCACVDGFIQAVDADGDGAGTRACAAAPGLDCDDGNASVTHNTCGGCGALPNAVGEDCLDCGAYICDGPESVVCATKPDAVVADPACQCQAALFVAHDADGDGAGTRACGANPGTDCDDADYTYISNECGGCSSLSGAVGGACNQCGVYACINPNTLGCVPSTGGAGQRCLSDNLTREKCVGNGVWDYSETCTAYCSGGSCQVCVPGTYQCVPNGSSGTILYKCTVSESYGTISWTSWVDCPINCNATTGQCTTQLFLPRDETFDVVPLLRPALPWHDVLNTASDSDYG